MKKTELSHLDSCKGSGLSDQRGSAIVIALFVLALVSVFVAYALTRSSAEAASIGNESSEARTLYAAQGSLEMMTRNFNKIFETKLNPTTADKLSVENGTVPGLQGDYSFVQTLDQITTSETKPVTGGPYSGLSAIRDTWRLQTTATDNNSGTQLVLTRNILNNRIPIFQFGIFYDDDLELFRPPRFSFGGRVHSNRHFFVSPGSEGVYFDSRVTAAGHVITQTWRNWYTGDSSSNQTWIKNASGTFKQLLPTQGSVLNGTPNVFASDPDLPPSRINSSFSTQSAIFDGNLQAKTKQLKLPLKVDDPSESLITMIQRGKEVANVNGGDLYANPSGTPLPVTAAEADNSIKRSERFANKTGIRVSLADSKAKLPGCASGVGITPVGGKCGVRLDGEINGQGPVPLPSPVSTPERARGYQPKTMVDGYKATRVNGERLAAGGGTREVWIKVETVTTDDTTGAIVTKDITEEILSLGLTEQVTGITNYSITWRPETGAPYNHTAPGSSLTATTPQAPSTGTDSRAVIKLQRFAVPGPAIQGGSNVLVSYSPGSGPYNTVVRYGSVDAAKIGRGCPTALPDPAPYCTTPAGSNNVDPNGSNERLGHLKLANVNGTNNVAVVPFPIQMFDSREGLHYDERNTTFYPTATYGNLLTANQKLSRNGVMSMIDIDVANLRRFLRGDFNGLFPTDTPFALANGGTGLRASWNPSSVSDIPSKEGWVVYVSDRRGDEDFDGAFDMEDIYGNNDGVLQLGEDANGDGILNVLLGNEAERYRDQTILPDAAAVNDHKYFRRGVRLVNGDVVPGIYDSATPANTRGFTVASENGIYVQGNFNTTGLSATPPANANSPYTAYLPQNTATHIPASIVGDAVTILSNAWNDGNSFRYPYDEGGRLASTTQMRFAMIAGDTIASRDQTPNQGGISPRLNGGVHNFKRFLERWSGQRLDYSGSLINLFNSRNNNGSFKCCNTVYDPPIRNWVFEGTFLDPSRIPPGTPFFQYVQTTGFERSTE